MKRPSIFAEYLHFLHTEKKYWMVPVFIVIFLIGLLVVLFETSVLAPFIYAIF